MTETTGKYSTAVQIERDRCLTLIEQILNGGSEIAGKKRQLIQAIREGQTPKAIESQGVQRAEVYEGLGGK